LPFLLAKLGARGVQVFVETHSEHVINGFRLAALKEEYELKNDDIRIFFFDQDFSKVDLIIEKTGRIPNWPVRFFDQYQHELAEILKLGAKQHAG
jgi:predicted ATPase